MGMSETQFREVEKWVGRGQAWDVSEGEDHSEEELEDLLQDEGEEEYDLSDIATTESTLDDIDPGGYDVDVEGEEEEEES
jgi:hypothetical protein